MRLWEAGSDVRIHCTAWLAIVVAVALTPSLTKGVSRDKQVGPVRVTTMLSPDKPIIGDQITLTITVVAPADVEILMPEFGEALDRYRIVDFKPRKKIGADGSSTHSQQYTIQPYLSGPQSIPPILVEFVDHRAGKKKAPDDLDAYEILTERIDFTVQSVLPDSATHKLKPPLGELTLEPATATTGRSWWVFSLVALLLISALAVIVVWFKRWRRRAVRRNAYEIARARLDSLLAQQTPRTAEAIDVFYVDLSSIVRRYLEDRFELKAPDLTTEEFLELAGAAQNLTSEHQSLLQEFLRHADLVKFAGVTASESDIKHSTDLAIQFLEETRQDAPLIEADDEQDSEAPEVAHV